jgi:glucan-binding YG repeat protein
MVKNQWIAIDNEDAGDDDQPDVWWYYFQGNGKAYKNTHSDSKIFKKVINGKTYCFDDEGRMQYGWVNKDEGTTNYDDNAWQECQYYFGDENDGAMTVGWREIALSEVDFADEDQPGDSYWDEDQVRWFYFKSSGKKEQGSDEKGAKINKTINGRKYGFDKYGRMIADWFNKEIDGDPSGATLATASRRGNNASSADALKAVAKYAEDFQYYSSPESGARYTKGWFKVIPGYYLNRDDYDDSSNRWYYADGTGNLVAGQIKSIKGKKYAFDLKGGMISGLAFLKMDGNDILHYPSDEDAYDTEESFKEFAHANPGYAAYYFSNDADHDGTMKTGTQKVTIDGETFTFKFKKSGTEKGQGYNGYDTDSKKYYLGGMLMKADSDEKVVVIKSTADDEEDTEYLETYTLSKFVKEIVGVSGKTVSKTDNYQKAKEDDVIYDISGFEDLSKYSVVNTSGARVKSGTKKDGDGLKVYVKDYQIVEIYSED